MPSTFQKRRPANARFARKKPSHNKPKKRGAQGEYINPSRFIKQASVSTSEVYEPTNSFADFELHELLYKNLVKKGYQTPSPIQDLAIQPALEGRDIIGIASTGTGKTAAFALPMLTKIINDPKSAAIVIAPTRELAQQIEQECKILAKGSGIFGALLIGGSSMGFQLRDLRGNPRVVIGTPGRIKDHLQRGTLKLENFNIVVLDEVDRMLDMGFVNDVTEILSHTNPQRQSLFFSATIDNKVRELINKFTNDPHTISLKPSSSSDSVHQDVVRYQTNSDRIEKLHDILIDNEVTKVIVFDETQRSVERLSKELVGRGFAADAIHGGKTQGQRQRALSKFKKDEINVLVATDVAARGIDVSDVSHVINYSVPKMYDDYIHRIGRAGRAGKIGNALTFIQN